MPFNQHIHPTREKIPNIMPKTGKIPWLPVLLLLIIAGCVDIVSNIEFPDTEPKIVVHSFISPSDTAVHVMLSWSNPISKGVAYDSIHTISNASVYIAEQGRDYMQLTYHVGKRVYTLPANQFAVEQGKRYSLLVEVAGHDPVKASCSIPAPNQTLVVDKLETEKLSWGEVVRIEYSFTDIAGNTENFYAPSAWLEQATYLYQADSIAIRKRAFERVSGERYISNKGRHGRTFKNRGEAFLENWEWLEEPPPEIDTANIYLILLTTDEHYYHYHKSLEMYSPGNPFSEPVLVYSNIEGGLGVFAGFSRFEIAIDLNASSPGF